MAEIKVKADSGGGTVSLKGPATTTSNAAVQLTLPVNDGDANQYLKTDGSGALSWATVSSDVVDDTTPQLGGNLDVNGNDITGDAIDFHAADGQVIAKLHKTNSSEFYFNNSKKLEVTNGGISVTGNVTPSSGLYLGGSGGSNHMDDYEEGSFTAAAYEGGSAITLSYHNTHGRYTKVGNMVTVWMWIRASGTTTSTGGLQVGGLPFTSNSDSYRPTLMGRAYGLANFSGNSGVCFWMNGSSSVIEVVTIDSNGLAGSSNTSNNVWTSGAELHCTFSYFV